MPRLGIETLRRAALVEAAIAEIGARGSLDVTVGQIARRAGVSSALAHHYFGGKSDILLAAMRSILTEYGAGVRAALARADGPRARLEALIAASFDVPNYRADVVAAWLAFYLEAQRSPEARRLLNVYHRRLRSGLVHDLRPLLGAQAPDAAETLAALIDGIYIRTALAQTAPDPEASRARVSGLLDLILKEARP